MKRILLMSTLVMISVYTYSQSNATEAKAAYLIAEESYGKQDYKTSLSYLQEASAILGVPNAKVLYLTIIIQRELANTDRSYLPKLDSSITAYQNAPDVQSFNEDKNLEVVKLKMQLRKEFAEYKQSETNRVNSEPALRTYGLAEWPFGASLEELRAKHPASFKKNPGTSLPSGDLAFSIDKPLALSITFRRNRMNFYAETLLAAFGDDNNTKGKEQFPLILERFRQEFTYLPKAQISQGPEGNYQTYIWESDLKQVILSFSMINRFSMAQVTVIDKTIK